MIGIIKRIVSHLLFNDFNNDNEANNYYDELKQYDNLDKLDILPYTYFGLGTFTNERDSYTEEDDRRHSTLLYDIVLDDKVPEEYHIDFEIPNN